MLFLAAESPLFSLAGKFITVRTAHVADREGVRRQPDFLPDFPLQRLAQRFPGIDAALGKLPRAREIVPLPDQNLPVRPL